ncbi:MAG: N-6 DNA methylase [Beijerinckiaceae bacterium]|nr:N-6 DNA methylase [Beijerinckiaceae bacterium]
MARKSIIDMSAWPSLSLEGNLIAPAMVAAIDRREATEQAEADYRIRKGLTIREEISTAFRVGQSHFDAFAKIDNPSPEATRRFVRAFLQETFGFDDLGAGQGAIAFIAGERVPIVVVPPSDEKLDRRSPTLSTDRTRSPAFALQDRLNEHDSNLWGLVTNGTLIRLMRDNASLTRPAYIEADLSQIFTNEDAASFAVLWLLIHRTRFGVAGAPATDCALERWREAGSKEGEVARDRLAVQVQIALKVLGSGFLEANPDLAAKLKSGDVNLTEWFNELLRLVYRLIFLMVAEDRNLLHPEKAKPDARKLYAEGYSLAALRAQCYRAASWDKHHDRYDAIKIVFHALAHGQDALALPALGGLFSDDKLPHLETARLRNRAFMEALYRLSWLDQKTGMVPVNWRAMETEELGSVYESLLELQPQLGDDGKTLLFASEAAEQKGNQRKTTGSYYTPDSLVQALLDTALDPVLDKTEAEADDPVRALLKLSVIDPACGSGHFLLAAARRIATRLARIRADGTPSLADFRHALRDVARSCLHGVDRNPMAVELTKVALWIETVDPGLPLGFFDAQIRCGDALLGVFDLKVLQDGIPDAAYKPLTGDDKETAKYYQQANRDAKKGQGGFDFGTGQVAMPEMKPLALDFSGFRELPEDTVEQIGTKEARFEELRKGQAFARATAAANLYVAAYLLPKVGGAPAGASPRTVPTTEELWLALNQGKIKPSMIEAPNAAHRARAFHWPLEFLDVMQRGGFDVVLGNPPWEKANIKYEEFFQKHEPTILDAKNDAEREVKIDGLQSTNPRVYQTFMELLDETERKINYLRNSGFLPLTSKGFINYYSSFAELMLNLMGETARSGAILQSGVATDKTNEDFFHFIVSNNRLRSLYDFINTEKIFSIDSRFKFSLVTMSRGPVDGAPLFAFNLTNPSSILLNGYSLTYDDIARVNPNTFTCPVFNTPKDAEIVRKMYVNAGLFSASDERGFTSDVELHRMFNATTDQKRFFVLSDDFTELSQNWLPVYEAKLIWHFDHRLSSFNGASKIEIKNGNASNIPLALKRNISCEVLPRWAVEESETRDFDFKYHYSHEWYLAIRMVTSASNERTLVAAIIPKSGSVNSLNLVTGVSALQASCLLANLTSLGLDYVVRTKVNSNNLNQWIIEQLPTIPFSRYADQVFDKISRWVLELTYTSHSLAPFARDLGYDGPPFAWDEDHRADLRADLDALYARAYGLTRDELRYIIDPADVKGRDYPSETFRVLKEKEIRHHGEYRTRRLVLAAWDRMETNGEFAAMGM